MIERLLIFALIGVVIWLWIYPVAIQHYRSFHDPHLTQLCNKLRPVFPELDRVFIRGSDKSLTLNKTFIFICLKDDQGNYYSDNMLTHVILHELAHALCSQVDVNHETEEYHVLFSSLLNRATQAGVYDPNEPLVQNYCGYQ
jgi:hypothetical protein